MKGLANAEKTRAEMQPGTFTQAQTAVRPRRFTLRKHFETRLEPFFFIRASYLDSSNRTCLVFSFFRDRETAEAGSGRGPLRTEGEVGRILNTDTLTK